MTDLAPLEKEWHEYIDTKLKLTGVTGFEEADAVVHGLDHPAEAQEARIEETSQRPEQRQNDAAYAGMEVGVHDTATRGRGRADTVAYRCVRVGRRDRRGAAGS